MRLYKNQNEKCIIANSITKGQYSLVSAPVSFIKALASNTRNKKSMHLNLLIHDPTSIIYIHMSNDYYALPMLHLYIQA